MTIDDSVDSGRGIILDIVRVEIPCAAGEGDATVGLDTVAADFADGQRTATESFSSTWMASSSTPLMVSTPLLKRKYS